MFVSFEFGGREIEVEAERDHRRAFDAPYEIVAGWETMTPCNLVIMCGEVQEAALKAVAQEEENEAERAFEKLLNC